MKYIGSIAICPGTKLPILPGSPDAAVTIIWISAAVGFSRSKYIPIERKSAYTTLSSAPLTPSRVLSCSAVTDIPFWFPAISSATSSSINACSTLFTFPEEELHPVNILPVNKKIFIILINLSTTFPLCLILINYTMFYYSLKEDFPD